MTSREYVCTYCFQTYYNRLFPGLTHKQFNEKLYVERNSNSAAFCEDIDNDNVVKDEFLEAEAFIINMSLNEVDDGEEVAEEVESEEEDIKKPAAEEVE